MKIRAKLIAAVCGALLLEGVVSFLAVYLGLSKFITPGALIAYSIVVILSIIAGAAIATVFSFRFVKRMEVVKEQLTAMAEHDLTYQIPEKTLKVKDELGDIARTSAKTAESLREMVETLNAMLSGMDKNIVETSERVDNLSEKLEGMSATTEQVSTGLMETAAAMHELDVSTDEIEVVMKGVAKQAQEGGRGRKDQYPRIGTSGKREGIQKQCKSYIKGQQGAYGRSNQSFQKYPADSGAYGNYPKYHKSDQSSCYQCFHRGSESR